MKRGNRESTEGEQVIRRDIGRCMKVNNGGKQVLLYERRLVDVEYSSRGLEARCGRASTKCNMLHWGEAERKVNVTRFWEVLWSLSPSHRPNIYLEGILYKST